MYTHGTFAHVSSEVDTSVFKEICGSHDDIKAGAFMHAWRVDNNRFATPPMTDVELMLEACLDCFQICNGGVYAGFGYPAYFFCCRCSIGSFLQVAVLFGCALAKRNVEASKI